MLTEGEKMLQYLPNKIKVKKNTWCLHDDLKCYFLKMNIVTRQWKVSEMALKIKQPVSICHSLYVALRFSCQTIDSSWLRQLIHIRLSWRASRNSLLILFSWVLSQKTTAFCSAIVWINFTFNYSIKVPLYKGQRPCRLAQLQAFVSILWLSFTLFFNL